MSGSMAPAQSPFRHATGFGRALVLATGQVFEFTDMNILKSGRPPGDNVVEHGPFTADEELLVHHTISGEVPNHFNRRLDPNQKAMVFAAFESLRLPASSTINFASVRGRTARPELALP
jgi:hypothetical protein